MGKEKGWANLKPIKKGEVRNPNGAKAHFKTKIKGLTKAEYTRIMTAVMESDIDALQAIANDRTASTIVVAVAACAVKAISKGDYGTIELMLQRAIGKVKDELDLTSNGETLPAAQVHIYLPANGRTKEENEK